MCVFSLLLTFPRQQNQLESKSVISEAVLPHHLSFQYPQIHTYIYRQRGHLRFQVERGKTCCCISSCTVLQLFFTSYVESTSEEYFHNSITTQIHLNKKWKYHSVSKHIAYLIFQANYLKQATNPGKKIQIKKEKID